MFKKVLESLKKYLESLKEPPLKVKKHLIRLAVIKFYEDLDKSTGEVNIAPFIRAEKTLETIIQSDNDIEEYYQKLLKYGWFNRIQ